MRGRGNFGEDQDSVEETRADGIITITFTINRIIQKQKVPGWIQELSFLL